MEVCGEEEMKGSGKGGRGYEGACSRRKRGVSHSAPLIVLRSEFG